MAAGRVMSLDGPAAYADALAANAADNLVAVKFYAPWCRACKALGPKFSRIAKEYGEAGHAVVFAEMDFSALAPAGRH